MFILGCVLAPVIFNIFLICITALLHKRVENGVTIDCRLDGNLFNVRRFQAAKITLEHIVKLRYADDYALVTHTPEMLQVTLSAVTAYRTMGLTINMQNTEVYTTGVLAFHHKSSVFAIAEHELTNVTNFKHLGAFAFKTAT